MAETVTWDGLRDLAAFRAEKGCAISLYVDLDPSVVPTAGDTDARVNSLLTEGERQTGANAGLTHDQRVSLKADFERIRGYLESEFDRDGARGLAIFSAGLDNVWRPRGLIESVPDRIHVGREFHLAPLVPLVGRGEGAIVAVVSRERGDLYRLSAGRLEEIADRTVDLPGQHDQGGWSQSRFQRHIEKLVEEHLRDVADELDRRVRSLSSPKVIVVCSDDIKAELDGMLSKEVHDALAGWTSAEAHASPSELLELAGPVLDDARAREEKAVVERWREESGRGGRGASGWRETLEAASDARIELLLYGENAEREAWQCPACGRLSAEAGRCPLDGTEMNHRDDGLDLAVHQAVAHGGTVWAVTAHQDLEPTEGIGAILRF
jgi:peptide chain release factor subunit 1